MTHQRLLGRFHGSDLRITLGNHRLSLDSGSQSLIRCSTGQISLFPSLQRFSVSQTRSRDSVPRGLDSLIRLRKGGLGPCAANGANEEAVKLFLEDKIGFLDIGRLVEAVVDSDSFGGDYTLADVYECDRMARAFVRAHL